MISVKKINTDTSRLEHLIHSKKIKDALDTLQSLISESGYSDFFVQQEYLESTYEQMLKYTLEGVHDPEREKIYMKLQESILKLSDRVRASLLQKYSGWHTFTLQQELEKKNKLTGTGVIESLDDLAFSIELDEIINEDKTTPKENDLVRRQLVADIYKHLWLTNIYGDAENSLVNALISCRDFAWHEQALQVSAILLSGLRYFDEQKFHRLMDFTEIDDHQVSGRALVSLVILLYIYDSRLYLYPSILSRMELIKDNFDMDRILEQIILQLIRTEDTMEVGKKLQEDLIPEMVKLKPKLEDKLKMEDLQEEDLEEGKNPEWENVFKESDEVYKKVDEFMKLQMEGADVYMTTFSMLKQFPFFNELANWLIPFHEDNPDLSEIYQQKSDDFDPGLMISGLQKMPFLCNSDKYSFVFNVKFLPEEQKKMLSTAFNMEMEGLSQMISDEEFKEEGFARRLVFVQYIQDLYRFFKISPFKNEFEDIFKKKLSIHNSSFFNKLVDNRNITRNIAEYYFEKEHFSEALDVFRKELDMDSENIELIEKTAYAYQSLKKYREALEYYRQIELRGTMSKWVTKNMGICYRKLEDYKNALEIYRKALQESPEDIRLETLTGFCLMKLANYKDALKHYFKIEYLQPDNSNVVRPIAWCYYAMGDFEKAEKYYQKIFKLDADYYDYVNYGHLKWAVGDRKAAIDNYLQSINFKNFTFSDFQKIMEEDISMLVQAGVDKEETALMMDYLRYRLT